MQIVIDIPEKDVPSVQAIMPIDIHFIAGEVCGCSYPYEVLPKGHGRLIDADKLKHAFIKWSMAVQGSFTDSDIASIVYNSSTIIEADKAGKRGEA